MFDPTEQFRVYSLFEVPVYHWNLTFTNLALSAFVAVFVVIFIGLSLTWSLQDKVPGKMQALAEIFYSFIASCLGHNTCNSKEYIGFIATMFLFVIACNLLGLIPFLPAITSFYIMDLVLAIMVLFYVTFIGFKVNGKKFWYVICPPSLTGIMAIIVVPIELISYFIRIFSLSIRLCANMVAGHITLHVFANLVIISKILGVFPFVMLYLLTGFEFMIAILQAYIFLTMCCIYMNDALDLKH